MSGVDATRDLPLARALLRRSVEAGSRPAALMAVALAANGTGADSPDWAGAIRLLREAANSIPQAARELALVEAMALGPNGAPVGLPAPEPLASGGAVTRFPALLAPAECEHVAKAAGDLLEPAVVVDPATGRHVPHPHRTSRGAVVGPTRETLPIRAVNLRIAALSGTDVAQGGSLTVLHYAPGQEFRPRFDALPHTGSQRIMTVLVYLNDGYGGGETMFPAHDPTVRPRTGDAILFTNTLADGSPDPRSRHAGGPVTRGSKWLATRLIRARPFSVWTGPDA